MFRLSASLMRRSTARRCFLSDLGSFSINRSISTSLIDIAPEVQEALREAPQSLVALESTIITHGMPYPQNLETALEVEQIVRQKGAVPATIAIVGGRIKVGLGADQLRLLARTDKSESLKTSRRDMSYVLATGRHGGTTVAGTLLVAEAVGIRIFATGGIGGVHREGERTMDISADLVDLGRCPVAVVSSGVKSILDIPRTLEYLETQGVCVATFGCHNCDFPAFYTRTSGSKAPYNLADAAEAAKVLHINRQLGVRSGILIGVPIPERHAMNRTQMEAAIDQALQDAQQRQVQGKEVTPFILAAVSKLTKGKSLEANMALIKNNASVAAQIAVELSRLEKGLTHRHTAGGSQPPVDHNGAPLVIGGSVIDVSMNVMEDDFKLADDRTSKSSATRRDQPCSHSLTKAADRCPQRSIGMFCENFRNWSESLDGATYHAKQAITAGGVGRNIAEGIYKIYGNVNLISAVGDDQNGAYIRQLLPEHCSSSIVQTSSFPTSCFTLLFDRHGDCRMIIGDIDAHQTITPGWIQSNAHLIQRSPLTVIDANINEAAMLTVFQECLRHNRPVFFEPTDMRIAAKPFSGSAALTDAARQAIRFISPNLYELRQLAKVLGYPHPIADTPLEKYRSVEDLLADIKPLGSFVCESIDHVLVTLGLHGVAVFRRCSASVPFFNVPDGSYRMPRTTEDQPPQARFYPARKLPLPVVNVSGAGDSFTSGFIVAAIAGQPEPVCISVALEAANCALGTQGAVAERYFDATHPCWTTENGAPFRMF